MHALALLTSLALGASAVAPECRNAPSRTSDAYWAFVEACGCARLEAPSRASQDYPRFRKACSQWRERNLQTGVVLLPTPAAGLTAADRTSVLQPPECKNPPSRTSDTYWTFIEACGCASLEPPSSASRDYGRYLKACSQWRERNP